MNTLVLGVGNRLRSDDGIGPVIIEKLKDTIPNCIDGGTDGLALLDIIKEYSHAIIVDAVNMNEAPGTIKVFSPKEAKIKIKKDALSTHGIGLAEVLQLAEQLEVKTDIKIVGIQPENIEFGEALSPTIRGKIPGIINTVKTVIPEFAVGEYPGSD